MKFPTPHDHNLGLQHDLETMARRFAQRRRMVQLLMMSSAAAALGACGDGSDGDTTASASSDSGSASGGSSSGSSASDSCVATASETAGPYPADGSNTVGGVVSNVLTQSGVVRSDIRSSFGGSTTIAPGVPLELTLTLLNSNNLCAPLSGYAVYLWHCTRDGNYSLYSGPALDENFLRGVQVADASGQVKFTTIFPGCYSGRYPHIHFEVYPSLEMATLYANRAHTSQLALPRDICSTVYSGAEGYSASVRNLSSVTISNDNVFGDNSAAQMAAMTPSLSGDIVAGYVGAALLGIPA